MNPYIDLRIKRFATLSNQAVFETLHELSVKDVLIEKGFETDGASLPRWVVFTAMFLILVGGFSSGFVAGAAFILGWTVMLLAYLFPPFGKYTLAAFAHDRLLESESRKVADRKMKELLEFMGITSFWSLLMYRIVRINSVLKNKEMG